MIRKIRIKIDKLLNKEVTNTELILMGTILNILTLVNWILIIKKYIM